MARGGVLQRMGGLFGSGTVGGLGEGALLDRFVTRGDPAAFEAIVARHGPMVWGVCRRTLRDSNDAEDAFQAVFVILARRAGAIRRRDQLGGWLHGVARRVSLRARQDAARKPDPIAAELAGEVEPDPVEHRELVARLHDEIDRLPRKYREPLVLCHLEGCTHDEAAARLGWPVGTVRGRLSRARDRLRDRLVRRGLAPGMAVPTLGPIALRVPDSLTMQSVRAATAVAAGHDLAPLISARALAWAAGGLRAMWLSSLKLSLGAATLAAGLATAGAGALALERAPHQDEKQAATPVEPRPPADNRPAPPPSAEPPDVFARIGEAKSRLTMLEYEIQEQTNHYLANYRSLAVDAAQKKVAPDQVKGGLADTVEKARVGLARLQTERARLEQSIRAMEREADAPSLPTSGAAPGEAGELSEQQELAIAVAADELESLREKVGSEKEKLQAYRKLLFDNEYKDPRYFAGIGSGGSPDQIAAQEKYQRDYVQRIAKGLDELSELYTRDRAELTRRERALRELRRRAGLAADPPGATPDVDRRLSRIEEAIEELRKSMKK